MTTSLSIRRARADLVFAEIRRSHLRTIPEIRETYATWSRQILDHAIQDNIEAGRLVVADDDTVTVRDEA